MLIMSVFCGELCESYDILTHNSVPSPSKKVPHVGDKYGWPSSHTVAHHVGRHRTISEDFFVEDTRHKDIDFVFDIH